MLTGLPVLCTQFDGTGELLIDPAVGCLVLKDDDQAMALQVIELLDDLPQRQAMGAAARALVKERHDWSSMVQTMERFYETSLAARKWRGKVSPHIWASD